MANGDLPVVDIVPDEPAIGTSSFDPASLPEVSVLNPAADGSSPDSALQVSPVDIADRAKISFGNRRGAVNFLKQKFKDVKVNSDDELTVLHEGSWHRVDPDSLGDPDAWSTTEKLFRKGEEALADLADLSGDILEVGGGIGGGTLGALAGPGGAAAGSVAGAGAAEVARSSLGRLFGTYDATLEEQVADAAWDMTFALGGYGVGVGVGKLAQKSVAPVMKKITARPDAQEAFRALGEVKKGSLPARDFVAKTLTGAAGVRDMAADRLVSRPEEVGKIVSRSVKGSQITDFQLQQRMAQRGSKTLKSMLERYPRAVGKNFQELEEKFVIEAGRAGREFSINPQKIIDETLLPIAEGGAIKPIMANGGSRAALFGNLNPGKLVGYEVADLPQFAKALNLTTTEARPLRKIMADYLQLANRARGTQMARGSEGARRFLEIRRGLDNVIARSARSGKNINQDKLNAILDGLGDTTINMRQALVGEVDRIGGNLSKTYGSMNQYYVNHVKSMHRAQAILSRERGLDTLNNAVWSSPTRNSQEMQFLQRVANADQWPGLAPRPGSPLKELGERYLDVQAASEFVAKFPHFKGSGKLLGVASAPITSPRLNAARLRSAARNLDTVRNLPQSTKENLFSAAHRLKVQIQGTPLEGKEVILQDPRAIQVMSAALAGAMRSDEGQQAEQLLQQSGVLDDGQ